MNGPSTISYHLVCCIFNVAARATVASRKSNQLKVGASSIDAESAFSVAHCPQALASRATTVTVTYDYSDLCL
jgi:hypothetical protein